MQKFNEFSPFQHNYSICLKGLLMDFSTVRTMGIVNVTPDSFFTDSRVGTEKKVLQLVEKHLNHGADFIDIGAFSSRPKAKLISETKERERLISPLKAIIKSFPEAIISIDTFRSSIAREAVDCGASIINDISGGDLDLNMFATIKELKVPYILMHMKGIPENMQDNPEYDDVYREVFAGFSKKLVKLAKLGVNDVILDVGFGFGKSLSHNYQLLKKLNYFHALERPLLAGISRKGMIQKVINRKSEEALNGTTAAHVLAILNGANILRVHDVQEAKEAVQIVDFYQKQ